MITKLPDNTIILENLTEAKTISYIESQFNYKNYYIGSNRTEEQLKQHIYKGKLSECITAIKLQKTGHHILHGIRILQQKPDDGTDLITETTTGRIIKIQIKTFNGQFYNIYSQKRLTQLLNYKGYILVCNNDTQKIYEITKIKLKQFQQELNQFQYDMLQQNSEFQLKSKHFHMQLNMLKDCNKLNSFIVL